VTKTDRREQLRTNVSREMIDERGDVSVHRDVSVHH